MVKNIALACFVVATLVAAVLLIVLIGRDRAGSAVSPGALSLAHASIGDRCTTCHTPYERIRGTACVRCHALAPRLLSSERTRFHAYVPSCVECHREHEGALRPTHMDHDALQRLLTERTPALAGRALDCAGCHGVESPHGGTIATQCVDCHVTSTWMVAAFQHPSPRSQECARCHSAPPSHLMEHFGMSQEWAGTDSPVEQCYRCHQTTAWNDLLNGRWVDHH